jgi:hypothetical protein
MLKPPIAAIVILAAALALSACRSPASRQGGPLSSAPYPPSRAVTAVSWDFSAVIPSRQAIGSDLWPCTWARDGNQYCAWGDGGGFDGNDDNIGRVSLGFARITGGPAADDSLKLTGKNVWGAPPYAEYPATFGGKVVSLISVDGVLYAIGGLWTSQTSEDPVHTSGRGPLNTLAWSTDFGKSWQIARWSAPTTLGTFLNFGRDNAGAFDAYVYIYYCRDGDRTHVYLKRVLKDRLQWDPSIPGVYQYLVGVDARGRAKAWSTQEADAVAIFFDANNVDYPEVVYDATLRRYLLTIGHYPSGRQDDSSVGMLGVFEAPHPWGPWATVAYYDDWGAFGPAARGDFLGLHVSLKWMSRDGKTVWCIFSGLHEFDSFNVVKATLKARKFLFLP